MEKELTIVLIVLLILFFIYMIIQKTDVCSIVRNEKEEFNVGALSRKNIGLSLLGIGAVAGVGGYISNKKKLKEWNEARQHWVTYDELKNPKIISPHREGPLSNPYTLIYTKNSYGGQGPLEKINPKITDTSLDLANKAMKKDYDGVYTIAILSYIQAIKQINTDCSNNCDKPYFLVQKYLKRIKEIEPFTDTIFELPSREDI